MSLVKIKIKLNYKISKLGKWVGMSLVKIKIKLNYKFSWKAVPKVYQHFPAENMLSSIEGTFFNHLFGCKLLTIFK
jgi:hypothetical protein